MTSGDLAPLRASKQKSGLIEYVESIVAYETPRPRVHSRHGYHPGLVQIPSGDLIALFVLVEAFEVLDGEYLLSIHAHRAEDPGIYVRVIDFSHDEWKVVDELAVWGRQIGQQPREGQSMVQMFGSLRFGQPSLLCLSNGEFLASHCSIEEGQGKIRAHRLRVDLAMLGLEIN